jgi:hypothetical protein
MTNDRDDSRPGFDPGEPSRELRRVLNEAWFGPCRTLELGCGIGTNAVFLAQQGFEVTAVERTPTSFTTGPDTGQTLLVFKKEGPR